MVVETLLTALGVGLICGAVAWGVIRGPYGVWSDLAVGAVGAVVGGLLYLVLKETPIRLQGAAFVGLVGAVIALGAFHLLPSKHPKLGKLGRR